jgi:hypothetical protein
MLAPRVVKVVFVFVIPDFARWALVAVTKCTTVIADHLVVSTGATDKQ